MFYLLTEDFQVESVPPEETHNALWTMSDPKYKQHCVVGRSDLPEGSLSTVFLSVEHDGGMFFESSLYGKDGWKILARYASYDEALTGHKALCDGGSMEMEA